MIGPRNPFSRIGPTIAVTETPTGGRLQAQEYDDGWVYEFRFAVGAGYLPPTVRTLPRGARILAVGQFMEASHVAGENCLRVWLPREVAERELPGGPAMLREHAHWPAPEQFEEV